MQSSPANSDATRSKLIPTSSDNSVLSHELPLISTWMTFLIAIACGLIVANLYYAQPLIGPISQALGLDPKASGFIVTLTQIGYGLGLLLIVPITDCP